MSIQHVYPCDDGKKHVTNHGGDCWCEPEIRDFGLDSTGQPAKVIIHHKHLSQKEFDLNG